MFKKLILPLFLVIFFIVGCSRISVQNKLPETKPKDFNFVFNYGIGAKNQVNTITKVFTKDMIVDSSITTKLELSNEEITSIYEEMKKINILDYPDNFKEESNVDESPFNTYSIKITFDGKEKFIYWEDKNISNSEKAVQLRGLFEKIQNIVVEKEDYKKLPTVRGGYY